MAPARVALACSTLSCHARRNRPLVNSVLLRYTCMWPSQHDNLFRTHTPQNAVPPCLPAISLRGWRFTDSVSILPIEPQANLAGCASGGTTTLTHRTSHNPHPVQAYKELRFYARLTRTHTFHPCRLCGRRVCWRWARAWAPRCGVTACGTRCTTAPCTRWGTGCWRRWTTRCWRRQGTAAGYRAHAVCGAG